MTRRPLETVDAYHARLAAASDQPQAVPADMLDAAMAAWFGDGYENGRLLGCSVGAQELAEEGVRAILRVAIAARSVLPVETPAERLQAADFYVVHSVNGHHIATWASRSAAEHCLREFPGR